MLSRHAVTSAIALTLVVASALAAQNDQPANGRISPEAAAYLDSALHVMQTNYLHRDRVDWTMIRRESVAQAAGAQTSVDTYPAIRFALALMGDFHSFLSPTPAQQRDEAARKPQLVNPAALPARPVRKQSFPFPSPFQARRVPEGAMIVGAPRPLAQIVIPQFSSPNRQELDTFATNIQRVIAELAAKKPCGWVVDLRGNGGGNIWPMLAGIGPLLGEGPVGGRIDADGSHVSSFYRHGAAGDDGDNRENVWASVTGTPVVLRGTPPVAVLIDRATGSSGEGIAVAFIGRESTRFFGEATFGASTSTFPFPLGDGSTLYLVTAVMSDRYGKAVEFGVSPDEEILSEATLSGNDPVVRRASEWLVTQKACAEAERMSVRNYSP